MVELPLKPEEIERLRSFDTPTICNVIELFECRPHTAGYMDGRIRADFPELPPIVGYAATATFRSADPPRQQDVYGGVDQHLTLLDTIPVPRIIVFQDLDDPPAAATFGEIMCATYRTFGCAGLITSGAGRDLDAIRPMKFSVFSSQTICSHGYCHLVDLNVPVRVGGLIVHPGDLLHGDRNGVTRIPYEIARAIIPGCEEWAAAERLVLDVLADKGPDLSSLRDARRAYKEKIQELGKRLRSERSV